jgi:hypothetical protein
MSSINTILEMSQGPHALIDEPTHGEPTQDPQDLTWAFPVTLTYRDSAGETVKLEATGRASKIRLAKAMAYQKLVDLICPKDLRIKCESIHLL